MADSTKAGISPCSVTKYASSPMTYILGSSTDCIYLFTSILPRLPVLSPIFFTKSLASTPPVHMNVPAFIVSPDFKCMMPGSTSVMGESVMMFMPFLVM